MASEENKAAATATATAEHSTTELIASAKLLGEAAQSALKSEGDKVDKGKVADAAGDLLDAAAKYGKLDEQKGIGQYVDKAADYLHHYQGATATATDGSSKPEEGKKEESGGGGGLGSLASLAGGFFKK